jgi:hypothetical protein
MKGDFTRSKTSHLHSLNRETISFGELLPAETGQANQTRAKKEHGGRFGDSGS